MAGAIWWDFDGTLVSRPRMWGEAGHAFITEQRPNLGIELQALRARLKSGFPWHDPDRDHRNLATPDLWWGAVHRRFADAFVELGWDDAHAFCPYDPIRTSILDTTRYRLFEDGLPVLQQLRAKGWQQLVLSNHVPELASVIDGLGLSSYFDAVITSGIVGFEKPHPGLFDAARAMTNAEEIWMIGDNPHADFAGARSYGVNAILVRTVADVSPRVENLWSVFSCLGEREHD